MYRNLSVCNMFQFVKNVVWSTTNTLDSIIEHGNDFYVSLQFDKFLELEELPGQLSVMLPFLITSAVTVFFLDKKRAGNTKKSNNQENYGEYWVHAIYFRNVYMCDFETL